jgi:hypothetical protein
MADDENEFADCVVCGTDMTEVYHYPVQNACCCKTRLCQHCRVRVKKCPTCRTPMVGSEVDTSFLRNLTLAVKGKTCDGCARFVRSRHTVKHGKECPALLSLRLRETMDETLRQEGHYRKVLQDNERLYMQINEMRYQLMYFRDDRRSRRIDLFPPSPDDGEDSDAGSDMEVEVVLETFQARSLPTAEAPA